MNKVRQAENNIGVKRLTRVVFITIAFFITLSFLVLIMIDKRIKAQSDLVDLIIKIEHNTAEIEQSLYTFTPDNLRLKRKLSYRTDTLYQDVEFLMQEKLSKSISEIQDSSLHYISIDSNYTKDEVVLVHFVSIWNNLHRDLNFLIYDDVLTDSTYNSYEEVMVWDDNDQMEKTKVFKIERHRNAFTQKAKTKINNSLIRTSKMKGIILRLSKQYEIDLKHLLKVFNQALVISILINFLILYLAYKSLKKRLIDPLSIIIDKLNDYNDGKLEGKLKPQFRDEIGKIQKGINRLTNNLLFANEFIKNIKERKHDLSEKYLSSKNPLIISLRDMSSELLQLEQEEMERKWIIEGQAEFAELLSKHTNNFQDLVDAIISNLVKYIDGLQGAIFIVNEEENFLDMVSSFAYDRKKFVTKRIELGEGLVGQAWQEEKYIHIDSVPDEHTKIKSGIGQASPRNILIVPLIDNQKVYGIIELASFKDIKEYQKEFVLRISENIAATLHSVEVNNHTQKLLKDSQLLTEKMKEQEEEMLQNLEELQSTQEDITRREFLKEQELKGLTEKLTENNRAFEVRENELLAEIELVKKELASSLEDNDKIRDLEAEIESIKQEAQAAQSDLAETIRMKELKIAKLQKKINNLQSNNE